MESSLEYYTAYIQPNVAVVFGALLMFGVLGGMLANRVKWMPTITAFMLFGFLIGPYGLGLITKLMLIDAAVLIDIALGLILYKLGNMLHPKAMLRSRKLMLSSLAESGLTLVFVVGAMLLLGQDPLLAVFIGAIAVSSSPAVLVHVAEELDAKGPVTERAKSLVAINNISSFAIFTLALPFALGEKQAAGGFSAVVLLPLYSFFGAALVGIVVGWVAIQVARLLHKRDEHYRFAIMIGAVMMTVGGASMLHMSPLFAPLALGMATRWFETSRHNLSRVGLGEGGDLFFIVLFVMAGAKIDPAAILATGVLLFLVLLVRSLGKVGGIFLVARYSGFDRIRSLATSYLMLPMAGMAIGLSLTISESVPGMGERVAAIVFTMVAVMETLGPFAATKAFRMVGEAMADEEEQQQGNKQQAQQQQPSQQPAQTPPLLQTGKDGQ